MKVYQDYVVVIPAKQAIEVANLLANLQGIQEEVVLSHNEDGGDPLFQITPQQTRNAHKVMLDALNNNWLGHTAKPRGFWEEHEAERAKLADEYPAHKETQ